MQIQFNLAAEAQPIYFSLVLPLFPHFATKGNFIYFHTVHLAALVEAAGKAKNKFGPAESLASEPQTRRSRAATPPPSCGSPAVAGRLAQLAALLHNRGGHWLPSDANERNQLFAFLTRFEMLAEISRVGCSLEPLEPR